MHGFLGYDSGQAEVYASPGRIFRKPQIGKRPRATIFPTAPAIGASAGITLGEKTGPFGTLRWRLSGVEPAHPRTTPSRFAPRPASSTAASAIATRTAGASRLDVLNLLNTQDEPDHFTPTDR